LPQTREKTVDKPVDIFERNHKWLMIKSWKHNGIVGVRGSSPLGSTNLQGQGKTQHSVLRLIQLLYSNSRGWFSGANNYFALYRQAGNMWGTGIFHLCCRRAQPKAQLDMTLAA